jgi:toxin-antitoxin system PIN domain toxin
LIYAAVEESPDHEAARSWLDDRLSGSPRVALPWPSLLAFVRITASPGLLERPVAPRDAWRRVTSWLAQPSAWVPLPTARHGVVLGGLLEREQSGRTAPDAHLAALAMEHGLRLCSADSDFGRFRGLDWENPLAG